jgi:hypothetical protein
LTVETIEPCQMDFVGKTICCVLSERADAPIHATQHLARDCSTAYGVVRSIGSCFAELRAILA